MFELPAGRKTLPALIQGWLYRTYEIEEAPPVDGFIVESEAGEREVVRVREDEGALSVEVRLPRGVLSEPRPSLDEFCQVVEGVSHFLHLAERARRELPTTQLELEIQAEVDKYVVLVFGDVLLAQGRGTRRSGERDVRAAPFDAERSRKMRARLFERVVFVDAEGTENGERYRVANDVAARVACGLERGVVRYGRTDGAHSFLRRFYSAGQEEKLSLALSA